MRRAETQQSVFVALVGSLFFAILFFWAAHQALASAEGSAPIGAEQHPMTPSVGKGGGGPTVAASPAAAVTRSVPGELGGWLRSGPITLVIRGGAYDGTRNIALTVERDGVSCRVEPEDLEIRCVLLRCEMDLDHPVVALHRGPDGSWREIPAERFVDRGYAQVAIPSFGEYRFEAR